MVGERETPTGRSLYLAHPIKTDASCLECHSLPAHAPHAMVASYGTANGFGWKLNKLVGAQIISVPMSVPVADRKQAFLNLMVILVLTLLTAFSPSMQLFTGLSFARSGLSPTAATASARAKRMCPHWWYREGMRLPA